MKGRNGSFLFRDQPNEVNQSNAAIGAASRERSLRSTRSLCELREAHPTPWLGDLAKVSVDEMARNNQRFQQNCPTAWGAVAAAAAGVI